MNPATLAERQAAARAALGQREPAPVYGPRASAASVKRAARLAALADRNRRDRATRFQAVDASLPTT